MIDDTLLKQYHDEYHKDPKNQAVEGAIRNTGIQAASINPDVRRRHDYVFSEETKRGKITDQKASGRCWMFSALNVARVNVMKKLDIKTFEFSQTYALFFDKLEKANFFLNSIIDTVEEPLESRLVWHLLQTPQEDGGQWDMFVGLLEKYGAVPKRIMPETFHSSNTAMLNVILNQKLREFAYAIRKAHADGQSKEDLEALRDKQLYFIYSVLTKALGEVPTTFTYQYRDEEDNFHRVADITPQDFLKEYGGLDLDDMVSVINAPTEDKPYGKTFTVEYLGTVQEAKPIKYLNAPIEVLKEAAIQSIKAGDPVWFGCDVGKLSDRNYGIMDKDLYQYEATLGEGFKLDKAERLDYSASLLTHAMVLVGVDLDEDGQPKKWKVENSWGKKLGDEGIFSMSDEWFDEFTYEICVPKKYLTSEWAEKYDQDPIALKPWDPMGSLAWLN